MKKLIILFIAIFVSLSSFAYEETNIVAESQFIEFFINSDFQESLNADSFSIWVHPCLFVYINTYNANVDDLGHELAQTVATAAATACYNNVQ